MTRPVVTDLAGLVRLRPGTVLRDANGRVLTVGTDRVRGLCYDGFTLTASFVDIPLPATVLWRPDEPEPEPEPRPIALEDVRVGDTVRVVRHGIAYAGVVGRIDVDGDLFSTTGGRFIGSVFLATALADGYAHDLTLLHRPKPEPAPVLPTEIGSVILDVHVVGSETVYPLGVLVDPWRLIDAAQAEDDYGQWVTPTEIVSWTPAKVVPA